MKEILNITDLRVHFHTAAPERFAVNGISLSMNEGEILGVVGESGSGKSVTAMSVCGLLPKSKADISGAVTVDGNDVLHCDKKTMLSMQGDELSLVFQEPMSSMNPTMRIGEQVEESLRVHTKLTKAERRAKAIEALTLVELPEPERVYKKYPHQLSGGQLQRVMIAAAIINEPKLLIADEPTTALDVTVQRQIIELLKKLNREKGIAILFISHNLKVVRMLCSHVAVMQRGKIVEYGDTERVFCDPQHEYTKKLISAIPERPKSECLYGK